MSLQRSEALKQRIRESFASQTMMQTLGAEVTDIASGSVEIGAPIAAHLRQQQGYAHAGLAFSLGDSAAGYAALSLLPADQEVVTSEIKINLLAPARGERLRARGKVVKAGKRLLVVTAEVFAVDQGQETLIALLQGTMVPVPRS